MTLHFFQYLFEIVLLQFVEMLLMVFLVLNIAINGAQTEKTIRIPSATGLRVIVIQQRDDMPIEAFQYATNNDAHILIRAQHTGQCWIIRLLMYC